MLDEFARLVFFMLSGGAGVFEAIHTQRPVVRLMSGFVGVAGGILTIWQLGTMAGAMPSPTEWAEGFRERFQVARPAQGTYATTRLNLRPSPNTGAAPIRTLPKGEALEILSEQGDWFEVRDSQGGRGWVSAKYVSRGTARASSNRSSASGPTDSRWVVVPNRVKHIPGIGSRDVTLFVSHCSAQYRSQYPNYLEMMKSTAVGSSHMMNILHTVCMAARGSKFGGEVRCAAQRPEVLCSGWVSAADEATWRGALTAYRSPPPVREKTADGAEVLIPEVDGIGTWVTKTVPGDPNWVTLGRAVEVASIGRVPLGELHAHCVEGPTFDPRASAAALSGSSSYREAGRRVCEIYESDRTFTGALRCRAGRAEIYCEPQSFL